MGKNKRGKQDGTGPHKNSFQAQSASTGKRQSEGLPCPKKRRAK